jgi:hypothetical protein
LRLSRNAQAEALSRCAAGAGGFAEALKVKYHDIGGA